MNYQIKNRWTDTVILEIEADSQREAILNAIHSRADLRRANLSGANLSDANLSGANLSGANLSGIKNDLWDVLIRAPREIAGLRQALIAGRIDGTVYKGDCACLVGTIANVRGCEVGALAIKPDASRPIERWFLAISPGHTPASSQVAQITLEWIDEFVALSRDFGAAQA
jgi:hypothetical protein